MRKYEHIVRYGEALIDYNIIAIERMASILNYNLLYVNYMLNCQVF